MNRRINALAFASALACTCVPAFAETLSRQDAVSRALAAHPLLAASAARREALLHKAALDALPPPLQIGLDVENAIGTGAVSGLGGAEATLRTVYTHERGGKARLRGERGAAMATVEGVRGDALRGEMALRAAKRYLAVLQAQETLRLRRAEWSTVQALQADVARRSERGVATPADVAQTEIALARAAIDLEHSEHELRSAQRALAALWSGSSDIVASEALEPLPPPPDADRDAEPLAVQMLAAQREVLDAERRLADSTQTADIEFGLGVRRLQALRDQALVFSATLPLGQAPRRTLEYARIAAEEQALEAQSQALAAEREQRLYALRQELGQAAREHAGLVERLLPSAARAVEHQQQAYARAAVPLAALLQAQQQLQQLHAARLAAALRYHRLLIDIERRVIGDLP